MDVYCPRCGEPWDAYGIQGGGEFTKEEQQQFWRGEGCPCCIGNEVDSRPFRAEATKVLAEVLGNDIDGIASMLDDAEYLGMLDN